jgi:hypothetical protein
MQETRYSSARTVAVAASAATVVLTAAAFWLSYEHLAGVASGHGLPGVRGWAWPATVDLFIVIGELLVLLASLQGRRDVSAIAITASGSLASIGLNVAGVGQSASTLDYVVAGIPPVAALFAFGVLMRQVHAALSRQLVLQPVVEAAQPLLEDVLEGLEGLEDCLEEEPTVLESVVEPQVNAPTITQEELVEKLVAGGEPLPGRKTIASTYGVTDWVARQALREAKERLQEDAQSEVEAQ